MSNIANYEVLKEYKPERAFLPEYLTLELSNQILTNLKTLNSNEDISLFIDFRVEIDDSEWERQCHCCHSNYDLSNEFHLSSILAHDKQGFKFSINEWLVDSLNESSSCRQYVYKSDINLKKIQILKYI